MGALYQPDLLKKFKKVRCTPTSVYFGELDARGLRHGIGRCVWHSGYLLEGWVALVNLGLGLMIRPLVILDWSIQMVICSRAGW